MANDKVEKTVKVIPLKTSAYTAEIHNQTKKCQIETENEAGEKVKGIVIQRAAYIILTDVASQDKVVFKITRKGKCYDSRNKDKKDITPIFVQAELKRMLKDDTQAMDLFNQAKGMATGEIEVAQT